jgi:phospholipase A1
VNVIYIKNGNILSLLVVIILDNSKAECPGMVYPVRNNLKGYLLISHGYGETLIDNNLQTTVGVL